MISDDEDDLHYCLKCHETIEGLENYVKHRKTSCNSTSPSQLLSTVKPLKADDFFSSLELQSSSKKAPTPSTSGKQLFGILTRSKTSGHQKSSITKEEHSKSGKNVWIGSESNSKLLKPAETNVGRKQEMEVFNNAYEYSESEDEYSESSEDGDNPPKTFTGGKWKPSSPVSEWNDDYAEHSTSGKWRSKGGKVFLNPPQNHTKGKWKPISPAETIKDYTYDNIKSNNNSFFILSEKSVEKKADDNSETITNTWNSLNCQEIQEPPPNYTKGKWKPTIITKKGEEKPSSCGKKKMLQPNRPFRKFNGGVQYFCSPCNRSLASKVVYVRHLKSELHLKRAGLESDLEDLNAKNNTENKAGVGVTINTDKSSKKRFRRKKFIKCGVCRSRVIANQMGKHLISHYHCRKGDISTKEAQDMVLENIEQIVLHSPYQCGLCKFYCNTAKDFMTHWNSQDHNDKAENSSGYFLCSFCQFSTHDNHVMQNHLVSEEHGEVISVINRSVPIVIRNINPIKCQTCSVSFLLNIQLRKHCELHGHDYSETATDTYQKKQFCGTCNKAFKSKIALQRHVLKAHEENYYFCSLCEVSFKTQGEINAHKESVQHRGKFQAKNVKERICDYCSVKFESIQDLKAHLEEVHPEYSYNCPYCDKKFAISQDLIVHIRTKKCKPSKGKAHSCDRCYYSTDSLADLWYHSALHEGPVKETTNLDRVCKYSDMYKCILCGKIYPKASLKFHLKNHADEKPYKCQKCGLRFARKNNWKLHLKNHEKKESETRFLCAVCGKYFVRNSLLQKHMIIHSANLFKCDENDCAYITNSSALLKKHLKTHNVKEIFSCEKCTYVGKSAQQLKRHLTAHESVKKFTCSQCPFTTRLGFHLKRHERIHSGSKPFLCPYCPYRCNNLENLRKHVISTSKHPGKCLYKCKFCKSDKFETNFAKDFKVHLMTLHGNVFKNANKATSYIGGIYDSAEAESSQFAGETSEAENLNNVDDVDIIPPLELDQASTNNVNDKPSIITQETLYGNKASDDLFSMFIITKDDEIVYVDKDTWNSVSSFDVEESEVLSFNEDEGSTLFQEHFET